ncbi:MAG: hypothetical protein LBM02_09435 [Lachnospiraceae bacterium]|jgi:hypothetical protein|nr:hypothetical protein [Lachnospiraceae bacterium]
MKIVEYITNNKRKIGFTAFVGILAILGIVEVFGTQLGLPQNIIGYGVTLSAIIAGLTGKSWKDYFKFGNNQKEENEEDIKAKGDLESSEENKVTTTDEEPPIPYNDYQEEGSA